jgi:chromosome segregation ATPase
MNVPRPGLGFAGAVVLVAGLGSAAAMVVVLARMVAREREKTERAQTDQRGLQTRLSTANAQLRRSKEDVDRLEAERARREKATEGETGALRRGLAEARARIEELEPKYGAAVSERDRAVEDLLAATRELRAVRDDLARANQRVAASAEGARKGAREAEEAAARLAALQARLESLLRPLLQDLRSADGTLRVRAHEALCAWSGRDLPFRAGGTPEEREADAKAIEQALR